MKQEIKPPVLIAVMIVVVLILGLIGWKMFSPPSTDSGSAEMLKAAHARKNKLDGGD